MIRIFAAVISIAMLCACGADNSQSTQTAAADSPTDAPAPTPQRALRPTWARLVRGVQAYTRAEIVQDASSPVYVCPSVTDFAKMMENDSGNCAAEPVGTKVVVHKTREDPGIFGGDAIYVVAKSWSGLIQDSDLVAIIRRGTILHCAENDDEGWSLYDGTYSDDSAVSIGRSAFKAVVKHTLESTETLGPAVHILSGGGQGKDGYLLFSALDKNCTIEGTSFEPDFDTYSYERGDPADGTPPE